MALSQHVFSDYDVLSHIRHMENTLQGRNLEGRIDLSRYYTQHWIVLNSALIDAAILTTANDDGQGHAISLRGISNTGSPTQRPSSISYIWYILDPQSDHPKPLLTDTDWSGLQGSILTFQTENVWEGLDPASDLHLADSSFPYNPEIHMRNNDIIHIDTTPEPLPAPPSASPSPPNCSTQHPECRGHEAFTQPVP
eukprot:1147205-Pelagomonas_calceolata.AAC.1